MATLPKVTSSRELDKYERLRQKHGAALLKVQAQKNKIKQQGTVNSWMEVFVLLNDQNPNHQRPLNTPKLNVKPGDRIDPRIAAGVIPPPTKALIAADKPVPSPDPSASPGTPRQRVHEPAAQPKKGLEAYDALPTPQNPKLVLANDRKLYDNALEQQLAIEQAKLDQILSNPNSTAAQIQKQKDQVDQLWQQKELVLRQQRQVQETRAQQIKDAQARAAKQKAIDEAKQIQVSEPEQKLEGEQLENTLKAFFKIHEPDALIDGRLEAVLMWTEERGVEKLNAMLREQYGKDLQGKANVENTAADQVQADRYARRLMGFYKANGIVEMQNWQECLKLGQWACKAGEAALNAKLHEKYNDDLDSYGQRIMLSVESKLRQFYERKNPEVIEKGLGPLLTWVVSNGVEALNAMLREKYGEDLNGKSAAPVVEKTDKKKSARAIFHRELSRDNSISRIPVDDAVAKRKEVLIKQLASFLEAKDPKRLQDGGLVPLVQWALPRTDRQVDDLLMESYGADLDDTGLRRLSFDDDEIKSFGDAEDGIATGAARVASSQMEDEFARAEIRSIRATTDERPLSKAISEDGYEVGPEPDF